MIYILQRVPTFYRLHSNYDTDNDGAMKVPYNCP